MRAFAIFSVLSLLAVGLASPAGAQTWNIQMVDDAGDAGYYTQIGTLSSGIPVIVYRTGSDMKLARWIESFGQRGWTYRTLAGNIYYGNIKMVVDDLDRLHIVWSSSTASTYGVWDVAADAWAIAPQGIGLTGTSNVYDLTLVSSGPDRIPYVAVSNNSTVKVATRDPGTGTWSNEQAVDGNHPVEGAASLAVDSSRGIHVAFCENVGSEYNLMYAVKPAGGTWVLQMVDPGGSANVGEYPSILIDTSDVVHIAYYDRTNKDLKYATPVTP